MSLRSWSLTLPLAICTAAASAAPALPASPSGPTTTAVAAEVGTAKDPRRVLLEALAAELDRAKGQLRLGDNEPPFFLGLQLKEYDSREISGRFGAVYEDHERRYRNLLADVRVGSYEFDSTADPDALGFDFDFDGGGYSADKALPLDDSPVALRRSVWLVVDEQYKKALAAYLKKRSKEVYRPEDKDRPSSFSREAPVTDVEPARPFAFDRKAWAEEVRRVTGGLREEPVIFDASMRVTGDKLVRLLATSEGARLVTEQVIFGLHVSAYARAPDGMLLENGRDFYGAREADLPRGPALDREVGKLVAELRALQKAPLVDPFTGPALLSPEATGVLFHEAVGHRLEGERQDDENEGRTFKGQVGRSILPDWLSIIDDPTLAHFRLGDAPVPLNGFYRFDEQGVRAQPVTLIEAGVLRGYLLSRRPVVGFTSSNGHGRSAGNRMPVARMANLWVKPLKTVPDAQLKQMLVDEARRQGKPYGIYVTDITGGNTNTASSGYQAFKGSSRLAYRIDAKTGAEELMRGVEIVGTPLSSTNKLLAMGDRYGIFNGFCGAESGYVPVSTVAPAALLGEIELQRTRKDIGRPPLLPPP
jgi:predicted Zn-dependent protease